MNALKGTARSGALALRILGILGAIIGIAAHFMVWTDINAADHHVLIKGYEGYGAAGIGILVVFAALLALDSVYAILVLALFIPYMLEQIIGVNLLRYMPLDSTELRAPLYLLMPTGFGFALLGSFAPFVSKQQGNH